MRWDGRVRYIQLGLIVTRIEHCLLHLLRQNGANLQVPTRVKLVISLQRAFTVRAGVHRLPVLDVLIERIQLDGLGSFLFVRDSHPSVRCMSLPVVLDF